jgi:hypothetical protein
MSKLKKIMGRGAVIIIILFAALITVIHQPTPALSQYVATTLVSGSTPAGNTAWRQNPGDDAVFVDIDTSSEFFRSTPIYITSLGGTVKHSRAIGATSIYTPTQRGFRVYVRSGTGVSLTPAIANQDGWHINWIAITNGFRMTE